MTVGARMCLALLAIGLSATASLLLAPLEALAPPEIAAQAPASFRMILVLQPALLVALGTAIGCLLAPRVGLGAPLLAGIFGQVDARAILRRQAAAALPVAVLVAFVLVLYAVIVDRLFAVQGGGLPLATRILYGGISEELIMRWGLMTLVVWLGWRIAGRPPLPSPRTVRIAIVVAAIAFAIGHLPLLAALAPEAPLMLVALVLIGNTLPGIAFGWLYWRRGIESAMMAHAGAHLVAFPVLRALGAG